MLQRKTDLHLHDVRIHWSTTPVCEIIQNLGGAPRENLVGDAPYESIDS
jgi:hypothetical protein